jgi:energy-coupling factor transporter ATP-binding protein EcfA2
LREVGLGHRLDAWPLTLSGGEAQRVALARALVREPQLLLLDEPFAALDALTRLRMHELVLALWRAHGCAVLMVTHDVDEAVALADRILVLDGGRIAAQERIGIARGARGELTLPLKEKLLGILGGTDAHADHVIPFPTRPESDAMATLAPCPLPLAHCACPLFHARASRLRGFVTSLAELVSATRNEAEILETGAKLLARLIAQDDWLPPAFAIPHPDRYQQYLLHCDSRERFSVVSFVWAPGQGTPIHDHRVWGLVGVLRGRKRPSASCARAMAASSPMARRSSCGRAKSRRSAPAPATSTASAMPAAMARPFPFTSMAATSARSSARPMPSMARPSASSRAMPAPFCPTCGIDRKHHDHADQNSHDQRAGHSPGLLSREEIALIDLREEADFARGHPLFAAQIRCAGWSRKRAGACPRRRGGCGL